MKLILIAIAFFLILTSCKKNNTEKETFLICTADTTLDSIRTIQSLKGSWALKKIRSAWTGKVLKPEHDIKIIFKDNNTYQLLDEGVVKSEDSIKLNNLGVPWGWALQLPAPYETTQYLGGYIQICNQELFFINSYFDGNDNLFEKIN